MVIPKECCMQINCGIIIGQESMRLFDLDTGVWDNTISWGDCWVSMVPRDYWMTDRILQQKFHLLKQTKTGNYNLPHHTPKHAPNEVFASEALVAVNYEKADLNAITENCKDLTKKQQTKLLDILKWHEPLLG